MATSIIKDKHLRLDQRKIDIAKQILGAKTETEAIEKALEMVIEMRKAEDKRNELVGRILARRAKMKLISEDTAEWIRKTREERDNRYGF
jgi:Ni,Fe-hydrogenase I large subunit